MFIQEQINSEKAQIYSRINKTREIPAVVEQMEWGQAPPKKKTADYLKSSVGWVYACVSAICDEIANIDLHLYKYSNKKTEEVEQHPVLDILNKANDFTTKFDLFWLSQQYLELTGECPWFVAKQGMKPTALYLLRPDKIEAKGAVNGQSDRLIEKYIYRVERGREIEISPDELIFIKYPDPVRPFRGKGTLEAAALTFDIDDYSEKFNRNFFYNSAKPFGVLKTDQKLTNSQREQLKKSIKTTYSGLDNAHKTMVLESGLDFSPLQLSQHDMDFMEQQRFSRDKILGIFKVPRTVIGLTDDVNRANAEATDYVFSKRTIKPKMQRFIEQLNEFLLPMFAGTENMFLDFSDPVPENMEVKSKVYQTAIDSGYMTIDEVRNKEGLGDYGGDARKIHLPMNMMPIEGGAKKQPKKQIQSRNMARAKKTDDTKELLKNIKSEIELELSKEITPMIYNELTKDKVIKEYINKGIPENKKEMFWNTQIKIADKFEKLYFEKAKIFFKQQENKVLANLPRKDLSFKFIKLDKEEEGKIGINLFLPVAEEIARQQGKQANLFIGVDDDFDLYESPQLRNYFKNKIFNLGVELTETTNKKLRKIFDDSLQAGESITQLRKRIEDTFYNISKSRAEMIARTETIWSSNTASEMAWKQSELVIGKEWLTAYDERTCPWCMEMNGKKMKLGNNFFNKGDNYAVGDNSLNFDYRNIDVPPLHPNCRCTLIPIFKDFINDKEPLPPRVLRENIEEFVKESKVTDTVYHGTDSTLQQIKTEGYDLSVIKGGRAYGNGYYFFMDEADAKIFGENIIKNKINIKNPFKLDLTKRAVEETWVKDIIKYASKKKIDIGTTEGWGEAVTKYVLEVLKKDGLIVQEPGWGLQVVVYDTTKIGIID